MIEMGDKNKMENKITWGKLIGKAFNLSKKAQAYKDRVNWVERNCRAMQYSAHYNHLEILDKMGNHLSDPVFQKLARNYLKENNCFWSNGYMSDALARIGNRTMTQKEYEILRDVSEDNLVNHRLDQRLRDVKKDLEKTIHPEKGAPWCHGPFGAGKIPKTA